MKFTIYGKNMHVSDGLKDALKKKFEKFDRYFDKETEVYATFSKEKNTQMLEVTIPMGKTILRAEERTDDMAGSIEAVVDKLEGQLRKHKTKLQKRYANEPLKFNFDALESDEDDEANLPKVVRTKKFAVKPMSVEEATMQMELLGHDFFVFLNADTEDVNVVYTRKDGNFGLIEPLF
ncbi:MAG: ribosome-associated translation inhibitor RaiA [Eubacteriaceae bacterium]|nr:ribosome-associated translation inhibitor RaiA [Eubacteriaceae bacterium]MBR0383732.1 ribosome-associated translation inhibitor RaiA [Eubacteriaceae bacterium]